MPENKMLSEQVSLFDMDVSKVDEGDLGGPPKKGKAISAVVTGTDWTTDTILSQLRKGNINLSPKFQRREAWTDDRKSKFIESLMLGYPVPQLVLAEQQQRRGKYIVIDGKQRLLAIRRFAATKADDPFVPLKLTNLQYRKELNGLTLEDIKSKPKFKDDVNWYENQPIRTVVVRNWEDESILYRIFIRLNTGSLPLSTQELRQALHPGGFLDFADDFAAESDALHRAWGIQGPDFRMRDVEILVRFFAFTSDLQNYRGNLKSFLDSTCDRLNTEWLVDPDPIRATAATCEEAVKCTMDVFDDAAFRRWNGKAFDGPFNRAIFDVMTYYFREPDVAKKAIANKEKVKEDFKLACKNPSFLNSIQTTTKSLGATATRLSVWGKLLASTLDITLTIPELVGKKITLD